MCGEELVNTCQEEEMVNSYMHSECEDHEEVEVMGHAGGDPLSECENTTWGRRGGVGWSRTRIGWREWQD